MATHGKPQGSPTAHREAEWKRRVADLDLLHQTAVLSANADSSGLEVAAQALGVDLAAVTAPHAQAYAEIEKLARARFEAAAKGEGSA